MLNLSHLCALIGLVTGASVLDQAIAAHHVPDGFTIEKVAGEPEVVFPMFAAFDEQGRLYVAESSGLDLYAELKAQTRKCRVRRLEDLDGDGRFETSKVFADRLVFPMGLVWRDRRLYVADPPDLIACQDTNGDGAADQRTVILTGFGHTDNGSLHGLIFGPDGLLYLTAPTGPGEPGAPVPPGRLECGSGLPGFRQPGGSGLHAKRRDHGHRQLVSTAQGRHPRRAGAPG
jgi:glucose/arabinose dehydrogenase